jgi:hypothetical protein
MHCALMPTLTFFKRIVTFPLVNRRRPEWNTSCLCSVGHVPELMPLPYSGKSLSHLPRAPLQTNALPMPRPPIARRGAFPICKLPKEGIGVRVAQ